MSRPDVSVRVGMEALGLCCESAAKGGTLGKGVVLKATDINPGALKAWPLPNVWLGVSVEDQQRADERIPVLLDTPAAVRWLSCEPLLGPLDLRWYLSNVTDLKKTPCTRIDWVVAGGESGPDARPMHPDWARSLRDQCAAAGVPFLFKQWGEWAPDDGEGGLDKLDKMIAAPARTWADGRWHDLPRLISEREISDYDVYRIGKHNAGRLLDGIQHDGYPA